MSPMDLFDQFKEQLHNTLIHLYDPIYQPGELLWQVLAVLPAPTLEPVRHALLTVIKQLRPSAETPATARTMRFYELLACRYVQELTQKETAARLGITPRHLRREQQEAIHWLAQQLWAQAREPQLHRPARQQEPIGAPALEPAQAELAWRDQVQQELIVLQQNAPGVVANVNEAVARVLTLQHALAAGRPLRFQAATIDPALTVRLHPSVLRQILLAALEKLTQWLRQSDIAIAAERLGAEIRITITATGSVDQVEPLPQSAFIQTILAQQGGTAVVQVMDRQLRFVLTLPAAGPTPVLVIDDNDDLVHFYRRYTEGTRYQIVHVSEGGQVFAEIERTAPQIIILDVMLPDVDGWELLVKLHEHPRTRAIPIMVCSVVRRPELALALGAVRCIVKPVHRQTLITALDQLLSPVQA